MRNTGKKQEYNVDRRNQQKQMMSRMAAYQKRFNHHEALRRQTIRAARKG